MKLSIITVCYNNKNGLQKTMESVANQTFTDYEYIVIDGGSTDGTIELIMNYDLKSRKELRIKNFKWISEKDNGIYDAMNKGIKMASGEYCYFLNSDDCIAAPNTLEKIFAKVNSDCHCGKSRNRLYIKRLRVKPAMTGNPDIIYGNLAIQKNNKLHSVSKFSKKITPYSFYRFKTAIHHQASFIKKELFEKYGVFSDKAKLVSDWIFFFEAIIVHKVRTQYINRVFALFLSGGESSTGINEQYIKDDFIQTYFSDKQIKKYAKKNRLYKNLRIRKLEKLFGKVFLLYALLNKEIGDRSEE